MGIDRCMDMCIDMCTDRCIHMRMDMRIDRRTHRYINRCIDMCIDMCIDRRINMFMKNVVIDMCGNMFQTCVSHVYTCPNGQMHNHVRQHAHGLVA